jgi:hypothetical protein
MPWDPNIGDNPGEMDVFVRFLIKQLLISIASKAMNYKNDEGTDSHAKSHLFMMTTPSTCWNCLHRTSFRDLAHLKVRITASTHFSSSRADENIRVQEGQVPHVLGMPQSTPDGC